MYNYLKSRNYDASEMMFRFLRTAERIFQHPSGVSRDSQTVLKYKRHDTTKLIEARSKLMRLEKCRNVAKNAGAKLKPKTTAETSKSREPVSFYQASNINMRD